MLLNVLLATAAASTPAMATASHAVTPAPLAVTPAPLAASPAPLAVTPALLAAADTSRYLVLNHGRPAGDMVVVRAGAATSVRYIFVDRNRGGRLHVSYTLTDAGGIRTLETRTIAPDGTLGEPNVSYELIGEEARWLVAGRDTTFRAPASAGTFYRAGGTPYDDALLARLLLRSPERRARLLPQGEAWVEIVADTTVAWNGGRERVRLAIIHDGGSTPRAVWLDARGEFFASQAAWFITVRPDAEAALPALRAIELAWRNARAEALARALMPQRAGPLVIRNGDVFDSERGVLLPRTTIVIEGDRIAQLGPADRVPTPRDATVIDATGRTVMPGMWDMHVHLQVGTQSAGALTMLATGLTTVRDLAADLDVAVSHRDRTDAGLLVSPRVLLAGFIEGPGAWAGPSEAIAGTADEALDWVRRYHELGYRQIKLYNLVHPDIVPAIAEETRRRGMLLSGHIPRGLSVPAAVRLGFDEINHAAFLFSTFFQDSLYVPTMRPYSGVAAIVAPHIDVDGSGMSELITLLRERGTVVDGTWVLWMGAATLQGAGSAASANYARLMRRLYDAGVTLVAGTDNTVGSTYITELELFEHAGIPAPEVLRIATIVPARVMGEDREYGSIAEGKVADIVIVNGRPTERIADLRNIEHVIRAGRVYDPETLRGASISTLR